MLVADAFDQIRAELDAIVGDPALDAGAKQTKLRVIGGKLLGLQGLVGSYAGDQSLVREAATSAQARKVLAMRANADARDALQEQGWAPDELDAQGFVSHSEIDKLDEEGLLAEAAEAWPAGDPLTDDTEE